MRPRDQRPEPDSIDVRPEMGDDAAPVAFTLDVPQGKRRTVEDAADILRRNLRRMVLA